MVSSAPRQSARRVKADDKSNHLNRVSKSTKTKPNDSQLKTAATQTAIDWEEAHSRCLDLLEEADKETSQLHAKIAEDRDQMSQSIKELRAEIAQATAFAQEANAAKEQAQAQSKELAVEVARWKQQCETSNASFQDHIPWTEMQSTIQDVVSSLNATTYNVMSKGEWLKNRHLASFLPGPNVFQDEPVSQTAPPTETGPRTVQYPPFTQTDMEWFGELPPAGTIVPPVGPKRA